MGVEELREILTQFRLTTEAVLRGTPHPEKEMKAIREAEDWAIQVILSKSNKPMRYG